MSEDKKEELLWEPESGAENIEISTDVEPVISEEESVIAVPREEDFEIPDIPDSFPVPPTEKTEEHIWTVAEKKQQIKEVKKKYRMERKRLRQERRKRGISRGKAWLIGILFFLLGCAVGAAVIWYILIAK